MVYAAPEQMQHMSDTIMNTIKPRCLQMPELANHRCPNMKKPLKIRGLEGSVCQQLPASVD